MLSSPGRDWRSSGRCTNQQEGCFTDVWASTMEGCVLKSVTEKYPVVERIEGSPEILRCLCDPFTLYEKDLDLTINLCILCSLFVI